MCLCYIVGDFNLPRISWDTLVCPEDILHKTFVDSVIFQGLTQLITFPTRGPNVLDILFTSAIHMVSSVCCLPQLAVVTMPQLHGFSLVLPSLSFDCRLHSDDNSNMYLWYRANYDLLGVYLSSVDWLSIISNNPSADQSWLVFLVILKDAVAGVK